MRAKRLMSNLRSGFVATARRLGLLTNTEARHADLYVQRGPDDADTGDLLIEGGFLSKADARAVRQAYNASMQGAIETLNSKFSRASTAIQNASTAAKEVIRLTRPKKAGT